ncbi:glyoxalase [Catellatospora sichuanensis]|uniref:glyoxalase n=1 Tax=Catellatospora sichuanensis TaxID=1969805 RepID=UPI0011842BDE|nr:glyoxalase [Catellatospora sichuanensis]
MNEATSQPTETTVPLLPCVSADDTLAFYQALGFQVTWRQTKPYLYLAFKLGGFDLHFKNPPQGLDPSEENSGGCLVLVDAVAPYHAAFTQAMRQAYGKVLATGLPRLTRYRPGASRFTLMDPSGNSIVFIQRDEPEEVEYGGSKKLEGLARVLDNARIYREFKTDDRAAYRALTSGLRKHRDQAAPIDRALALAALIELAVAMGEPAKIETYAAELRTVQLTESERERVDAELRTAADLEIWLTADPPADGR